MTMIRYLRNRRLMAGLAFVVLLLLVALWPETTLVDLAPVERGGLLVTVDEEGETRVRDRYLVTAPVTARLLRIELEPGDPVERSRTELATLLPQPLDPRSRAEAQAALEAAEAGVGSARAERRRAEAALALARSELTRVKALFGQGIASQQDLDRREAEARSAEDASRGAQFAAAAAEHQRDMARARLAGGAADPTRPIVISSPVDGVVLKRYRESEAVVPAGDPLIEVGDAQRLEIVSDLLSTDAVRVKPGQEVAIEQWGGDHPLRGRVKRVEPSGFMKISALGVEEQRVNVVIDFADPAEARAALGDGYRVEVRIVVWEAADVVKVPTSSLFRRGETWAVFTVDGGRARLRPVEVGRRNGQEAQVLSGLTAGERVIVHPSDTLADGSKVAARAS
jgi:HlyD family secretion protein